MRKMSDFLEGASSVGITAHTRPDGDAVGSALALYGYIRKNYPEIDADVFLETPTEKLSFLKYFDCINSSFDSDITYDVFFCLDSASLERIGKAEKFFIWT